MKRRRWQEGEERRREKDREGGGRRGKKRGGGRQGQGNFLLSYLPLDLLILTPIPTPNLQRIFNIL
jgi:hypothetical protein